MIDIEIIQLLINIRAKFHGMSAAFAAHNEGLVLINPEACETMLREGIKMTQKVMEKLDIKE